MVLEVVVDQLSAEEKYGPTSKSRPHRNPSPWEDNDSAMESDEDYVPGSSEMESSVNDEPEDLGEEIGRIATGDETDETDETDDGDETDETDEEDDGDKTDETGDEDDGDEMDDEVDRDEAGEMGDKDNMDEADAMDDEANGSSEEDNHALNQKKKKRIRHRREVEVEVSTAWTWKKETNDRLVREWKLEKEIDENPAVLHPV